MEIGNFNFWCPVEISKAIDPNTGEEQMLLGGIASTADEDSDGEFLDPKGFDIKPLLNMLQNLDALVEYLYQFMEVYSKEDLKQIKCLKDINCHLDIKNKPKKM